MPKSNIAARAGRWSAHHRKTAILGWIAFVVLATVIGGKVGNNDIDQSASGNGESKRGDMIVEAAGFPDQAGEQVLVQGKGSIKAGDPQVTAAVKDVVSRLERIDGVTDIESPLNKEDRANTVSKDGRSVVVNYTLPGDADANKTRIDAPLAAVAAAQKAHPGRSRRGVRRRVGHQGVRRPGGQGRAEGPFRLLRPDARHPAGRLRRARRRRPPARARRHRRGRHGRPARAGQPALRARA